MAYSTQTLDQVIRRLFAETFVGQNEGLPAPTLTDDTVLLETGIDSLGFAILVTHLEEELGYDPFSLSARPYYPSTYREFLAFYANNQPT